MRGAVHHIDLTVRDPIGSRPFYEAVLGFLGYVAEDAPDGFVDFHLRAAGASSSIGLVVAKGEGRDRVHDRYSPGLHHLAWRAESREEVAAFYDLLLRIGATILDPPADYPEYGPGYHAVFFADPDGLKLEYVYSDD